MRQCHFVKVQIARVNLYQKFYSMPTKMKSTEAESNKVIEGSYSAEWQLLLPRTGEAFSIPPLTWELKRMFLSKIKNVPT